MGGGSPSTSASHREGSGASEWGGARWAQRVRRQRRGRRERTPGRGGSGAAGGASCGPDSRQPQHCRSAFGTGDELILVYVHFIDSGSLGLIFPFSFFTSSFDRSTDVWAVWWLRSVPLPVGTGSSRNLLPDRWDPFDTKPSRGIAFIIILFIIHKIGQ